MALYSTISIIKESIVLLMDGCENPELVNKVEAFVRELKEGHEGMEVEGLRVWSSNRGKNYMTIKVTLKR